MDTEFNLKYKAVLRLPTDTYAYIEMHVEDTPENIIQAYRDLTKLWQAGTGLVEAEFYRVLDKYVWKDGTMDSEEYAQMNLEQQAIIQTIKKSRNRNNYKLKHQK